MVGSDSGEIPNVIGNAGLVFPEGQERELARCLRELMDNPAMRELLGRRGRERVPSRIYVRHDRESNRELLSPDF